LSRRPPVIGEKLEKGWEATARSQFILAGPREQPIGPGLDPLGFAQAGKIPPDSDQRHLDSIAGGVGVTQDPVRDTVQPFAQRKR
jgi:hypothetical protein